MEQEKPSEVTPEYLHALLSPFDPCDLECDGMTRVVHTILTKEGIDHRVFEGHIIHVPTNRIQSPHLWVEVEMLRIDYRARMWLGDSEDIPHGVFQVGTYPNVLYQGSRLAMPVLSDDLFRVLTTPFPSIDRLM
jgi:hypothetical protein